MTSEQSDRLTQAVIHLLDVIDYIIDELNSESGASADEIEDLYRYKETLYDVILNFGLSSSKCRC